MYATVPPDGSALESEIACAMVTAAAEGFAAGQSVVLNLSLGTTTTDNEPAVALQAAVDLIEEMAAEEDKDVCSSPRPATTATTARSGRRRCAGWSRSVR